MRIDRVYLGSWTQRTNMHLEELFRFLRDGQDTAGSSPDALLAARADLALADVKFREASMNVITAHRGAVRLTVTEDGVVLAQSSVADFDEACGQLRTLHDQQLLPAMRLLYGRGAPTPKEAAGIPQDGTLVAVVSSATDDEILALFAASQDEPQSVSEAPGVRVFVGRRIEVVDFGASPQAASDLDALVGDLVFFREFERQLHAYLRMHRQIWGEVAAIREQRSMRYADFPRVRDEIMSFEKTLDIVTARLAQMDDILGARRNANEKGVSQLLDRLGMFDFNSLNASRKYVSHLWQMTLEYADGTLRLLETLYQENTQRELNALKFITLTTAITSFFGMNIAFPWDAEWRALEVSSFIVAFVVIAASFTVYWALRIMIHNRRFVLREDQAE